MWDKDFRRLAVKSLQQIVLPGTPFDFKGVTTFTTKGKKYLGSQMEQELSQ
jgi:hypothetical protein